jgi:hypothetical protein
MSTNVLRNVTRWVTHLPTRQSNKFLTTHKRDGTNKPRRKKKRRPAALRFQNFAPLNSQTLLFPPANIGIIWSPKSACTKVVLWYFKLTGLLDAAMFYHPWPHNYRMNVLYSSREYIKWMRNSDWKSFTWYQFSRDPVKRLLSSYRHNLGHGYADERISKAISRTVTAAEGYSLDDFLNYLDTQDLGGVCDPHVKMQWNRIADFVPINTINIDEVDMLEHISAIERKHGLSVTDFNAFSMFQRDERRRAKIGVQGTFSTSQILNHKDAKGIWPLEASVLDAATTQRIKQLYARDMKFLYNEDYSLSLSKQGAK